MTFNEILSQTIAMLQQHGRVSYRALKRQFAIDDDFLEDLKAELVEVQQRAVDQDGTMLVWTGDTGAATAPMPASSPATAGPPPALRPAQEPLAYTPAYLAEKIFTSRGALEGERKQVTVLFADLKGSLELLADRDPEEARQFLDPVLERMMAAVHRYEGTVNQVMGDGIMALFGAPLAHEDHAIRACYAALAMQHTVGRYAEEVRRQQGLDVLMHVGLNSGEVVVRAIGNDLHMDYTAVGQTTHLAARIDRLPPEEKHLVQTAAVIGNEVPLPLLQAIAELPEAAVYRALAHLQAAEFLYETRLFPDHAYTFKHALTHEVAYNSLLQERRRVLHVGIVEALERLASDRLAEVASGACLPAGRQAPDQVERLAHHAFRGEVWDKAYALRLLGEIAARREPLEIEPAESYYRQALALAEALGMRPLQAHCHHGLGTLYATVGQRAQARTALTTAIEMYRAMAMTFWLPQAEAALAQMDGR